MGTTTTNAAGYYEFANLCPDDYYVSASTNHASNGSVNATDAAQLNAWAIHPYSIEKVRFHAGDVGTSGTMSNLIINATDAGRIQQNFVNEVPFDVTWVFWKANETTNQTYSTQDEWYPLAHLPVGSDATVNMYGLCKGDFNRSYNPQVAKSASNTLQLVNTNNVQVNSGDHFDLPVSVLANYTVGASSVILNFPTDLVEVQDVVMNAADGDLQWSVNGNELRIGWYSTNPLALNTSDNLFTLKLKALNGSDGSPMNFTLAANPLNELADGQYDVISNAILGISTVNSSATGVQQQTQQQAQENGSLTSYPNPFNGVTTLAYELPFEGTVTLEVYNYLGSRVNSLVNEAQLQGVHSLKFDANNLPSGVYFATLKVKNETREFVKTIKIVNSK